MKTHSDQTIIELQRKMMKTQQAEMMDRHFVKVQEFQQMNDMQNILTIQQQQQQQPVQPSSPHNWWQKGQQTPHSLSGYGVNQHQQNGAVSVPVTA
eukprot:UN08321